MPPGCAGAREQRDRRARRQVEAEEVVAQILQIGREAHRHRHVRDGVFEDQIPADDPGEDLAQDRVGVGVGAAGDGNHRGQFGVAERREAAGDRHQQERKGDGRARRPAGPLRTGVRAVEQQIENGRVQDRLDLRRLCRPRPCR